MTDTEQNIESPFNEEFCTDLEYRVCDELEKSTDIGLKGFWCDGVSWFPNDEKQLTKKHVNDTRKIETKAWIGKDGQGEYQAIINFGQKALSKYARSLVLTETIPQLEMNSEWIEIDIENKTINIFLL